jgi:2-polyprenyl-3-methyl-5-hydroxy-6-metoxy-1,4-benzoquinol methylase
VFKNLKKLKHDVSKVQSEASTSYSGTTELINAECGLEKYNSFLVDTFARNFVELGGDLKNSRVLDFGAGLGTLADLWNEKFNQRPVCVEIDQNHNKILKNRGYETYTKLDLNPNKIDLIYTSNVLEHIDDDVTVLRELAKSLESNGMIVIYVPAIQFLYSDMDRLDRKSVV